MESNDVQRRGMWRGAYLQCTPYYHDFAADGRFAVMGGEILPSSTYTASIYPASCKGVEPGCPAVSAAFTMTTRRSGDLFTPFQDETVSPTTVPTQPGGIDVSQLFAKFRSAPGAVRKWLALMQGASFQGPLGVQDVGSLDILQALNAFRGQAYPWSGPCTCPSTVSCASAASCHHAATCPSAPDASCIRYCESGPLTGRPCVNTTSCGQCTAGTTSAVDAFCTTNAECGAGGACNLSTERCTAGTLSLVGALCDTNTDCGTSGVCNTDVCPNDGFCRDLCGRCD